MSSGISFSGLSSGLDTDSIVNALTKAESTRKTELQSKQNTLKLRQTAYATLKTQLSSVTRAAGTLNTASAFATMKSSVGDDTIASMTTTASAAVGSYDINVTQLARANKVASASQADTSTALGKAGTANVNGKSFKIESSDSLANIAQKINGLGAGVTASVMNGGAGRAYLTVSSSSTGTANGVALTDLDGTALADLGMIGSASTLRQTSGNTAVGTGFSSSGATLQSSLGSTSLAASTVTINGTAVDVDPSSDTLDSLAAKINAASISGVTASVQATTSGGTTTYALQIAGSGTPPSISDSGNAMRGLGILRATPGNELVKAQDAAYTLDGVSMTASTNTVSDVVGGATFTLKKVGETTLDVTRDTGGIEDNVSNLVSSVNSLLSTISSQSSFDSSTYESGVLFGDSIARQTKSAVVDMLFSDSPGVTGKFKNLASVGVGMDKDGSITFDTSTFEKALSSDPDGVSALFRAVGTSPASTIKYVSSTTSTNAASAAGFAVNISQVATRQSFVAGTASTGPSAQAETLTFKGSAFGASGIAVNLDTGTTLSGTVAKINADSRLKDLVTASVQDGKLRIDSKKYGAAGNFTLTSNFSSSASNSGVGVGGEGTTVLGVDVSGTINGEAATGSGQFLTGVTGNAKTAGLQIQYTGTATGNVGTMNFSKGVASRLQALISGFTDSKSGIFSAVDTSLEKQITSLDTDMDTIDKRITSKTAELKARFAAMEDAVAKLKSQSETFTSMFSNSSN